MRLHLGSRGAVHFSLQHYDKVLADLGKAIEIAPENVFALERRGEAHRTLQNFNQALLDLDKL